MSKVPSQFQFYDVSDYARPFGNWIAQGLVNTPINAVHVTWVFIVVGFISAYLYTIEGYAYTVIAGLLLVIKSGLDAADGSLARLQNRPSKVGRFLDAIGDFFVNAVLVIAITSRLNLSPLNATLFAFVALASITWQVTIFNYYYVTYRWQHSGDTTSSTDESQLDEDLAPWDNIHIVRVLHRLYLIIYAWQDSWVAALEKLTGAAGKPVGKNFMVACSLMGLGVQLLIVCLFSLINQPEWALYVLITVFNVYWIGLVVSRRF